ncbi:hypothetical protein AAF712_012652 [Marasmius tenuissimus]|uniref:Transmembrane protein n=1 Tax=Marasmius tenuissimus TaxID=585030 RepID=A0ABR2ZHW4_9AGAR
MPSFRTISLFFVAALATFTAAAPANTPPIDVYHQGGNSGCTTGCDSITPVPETLTKCKADLEPLVAKIGALVVVEEGTVEPIVEACVDVINKTTAKIQVLSDTNVGVEAALGVGATIDVVVKHLCEIVALIVACVHVALKLVVQAKLAAVIKIFIPLCLCLNALIQVCVQLFVSVGLAAKLGVAAEIKLFAALGLQLGIQILAFLGLGINLSL